MTTPRRSFLGRLAALLAVGTVPSTAFATPSGATTRPATWPDERWLEAAANGEHRIFVETGTLTDAIGLRRTVNYLDAMKNDYQVPESRLGVVVGVHGAAVAIALNDAMWAKHRLGERGGLKGATGAAPTANPFRSGAGSVEALAARGVHLLACNNSLRRLSRELAGSGGDANAVHAELTANVQAPFLVVPAMIVAVGRAQERNIPVIMVA